MKGLFIHLGLALSGMIAYLIALVVVGLFAYAHGIDFGLIPALAVLTLIMGANGYAIASGHAKGALLVHVGMVLCSIALFMGMN